jgi:hypothetical protein
MKEKNPKYKNQGHEPINQKDKANKSTSRHNPKIKQKQTIKQKRGKPMQIGPMVMK